jgi:hypothetical protein
MSNFPNNFDDDTTLPFVNDNITEIGGAAIDALRDAVFAIEQNIGLGAAGTAGSLAARLGISINPDGTIKSSALTSLGLVTLPITQDQIASYAQIPESKLHLDHRTQDLYNYIRDLSNDVNNANGWIAATGIKLAPHLAGVIYRHTLDQIDVSTDSTKFLLNNQRLFRNNSNSYNLINDINSEFLNHQWADGAPFGTIHNITTNNGSVYPSNYGHTASGIFLNTSRFNTIPQTAEDLQLFAEFIDGASIFLLGTRIQNLYSNGISRASRSSNLTNDGYGQNIIPNTPAIAYLLNIGNNSSPFDNIDTGDDIIEFKPSATDSSNNSFDAKFALVKIGDIIRINYGTIEVPYVIKEKKYIQSLGNKKYVVRIAGKNLSYSPNATARIDRPLFYNNKFGVLALASANNNFSETPSLIVSTPRGGEAIGNGFSLDQFNEKHYLLYLAFYPTGFAQDGYTILPAIDVTGNQGTTPGLYTIDSIVEATNAAFRQNGFNYRFIAFSYQGEFGIMLADSYNNAAFSILSAMVTSAGFYDQLGTSVTFSNNVVDVFPTVGSTAPDPLGFGPFGANVASPPYMTSYGSPEASQIPTKLFVPLRRNNFYVNGVERERLNLQIGQALDGYGDGYWIAQVINQTVPAGRVQTTYRIPLDLSSSDLKVGKTLVVQSIGQGTLVDFGRFIIQAISFSCSPSDFTDITVYDAVHAKGFSPSATIGLDGYVALYFNSDSVSFNTETATDFSSYTPFKRHFEVYIDQNSNTFTHERGRVLASGSSILINSPNGTTLHSSTELAKLDIIKISPKLRGYQFGDVTKISLNMISYDTLSGTFDGYLASYNGTSLTRVGPTVFGKKGEITRFYDESNVDYIDLMFDVNTVVNSFSNQIIDFQLFPTLSLDNEIMLIGTCQLNDTNKFVNRLRDERQFGNTSEKELSTSALNFIALPEKLLHFNGVVRGFDIASVNNEFISITGGTILVNGKIQNLNNEIITIPKSKEYYLSSYYPINWALCVNSNGELITIPITDFDVVLGTPSNSSRLTTLFNAVSSNTYVVDSSTFSNLLNNRKDLTVLYIVSSTVTGSGLSAAASLTYKDVRRFVNDQDSSTVAVVTNDSSQGNFKTFDAAAAWVKLNSAFQNTIHLKGDSLTSIDPKFNVVDSINNYINIVGAAHQTSIEFNTNITMSNVKFTNLDVTFLGTATLTNVDFKNCRVFFTATTSMTNGSFERSSCNGSAATSFNGTAFNTTTNSFSNTASFTSCKLTACTLTIPSAGGSLTSTSISSSTLTVNGTITTSLSSIVDCTIQANIAQSFTMGNSFRFERNVVTYAGTPGGGYTNSDMVNNSSGLMFATVSTSLTDLTVRDNTFTTAMSDRFGFFSLQLTTYGAIVENVDVSKNKFISTAVTDDIRAVISIVSTLTTAAGGGAYPKFPKLVNVSIDGNFCNYNQMIVLTTTRLPASIFNGAMLTVTNTRISNNTCGTIGFITAASAISDFSNAGSPNSGFVRDKEEALIISGNTCKFITNLDAIGDCIFFRSTVFPGSNSEYVQVGTGGFIISNNSANWIQVGCSGYTEPNDGCIISNNRINPDNPIYLNNYIDSLISGLTPANVGLILRREWNAAGPTNSLISGNIISQKTLTNALGAITFYYDVAMACFNNANIVDNTISGVINSNLAPILYLWATGNITVTNNLFNRSGLTVQAYVVGQAGATNRVSITENIFDSPFVDAGNTIEDVGLNIPAAWDFYANKNQTAYASLTMYNLNDLSQTGNSGLNTPFVYNGGILNSSVKDYLFSSSSGQNPLSLQLEGKVSDALPIGVNLLYAVIGFNVESSPSTVNTGSTNNISYRMWLDKTAKFSTSSPPGSFAGSVADNLGNLYVTSSSNAASNTLSINGGNVSSFTTTTQYMYVDLSSLGWANKNNQAVNISIIGTFNANGFMSFVLSPLLIKYRW